MDKISPIIYDRLVSANRLYETQNPWITFNYTVDFAPLWAYLGEAYSKCQHMAGTPLQPAMAEKLARFYMIKGAVANTAIEGNTLSEEEAADLIDGSASLPPSQQYLEQEVRNVMGGLTGIFDHAMSGDPFDVTTEWIKAQNAIVLRDLELEDHVVPGEYTEKQLVVGSAYRPAPPADVPYLMEQLVSWIHDWLAPCKDPDLPDHQRFYQAFLAATLTHLYIAWIHPFGDGNGRTARLLECAILANSGVVPWISSNLLSDHYNRTRTRYYQRLANASRLGDVAGFLAYAAEGYVDMLRQQIVEVQGMQREVAWINFVHAAFHDEPNGPTRERRRDLALNIPERKTLTRREMRLLTPELAGMYAGKEDKTMTRDLNRLRELQLIQKIGVRYKSNIELIDAFRPPAPGNI